MAQDPYSELGVGRTASADEVRKAFRKLAKQLHPDRNPGDKAAEERFKRVSAAFDILGDPEKRAKFDRGEIDADGREAPPHFRGGGSPFGAGGSPFGQGYGPGQGQGGFEGVDLDEILGGVFGARGRGGRAGPGAGRNVPMRGADVQASLEVSLEEAIAGATRRLAFSDGRMLDVTIPKGASDGQTLRLRGQGQPGRNGGPAGDALIELSLAAHRLYRREGADLHMDLPVSIPDAILGAKVEAPTPDGPVTLTVPPHSNAGSRLRLKGRGAVDPVTRKRGDLFAHIAPTLPEPPDPALDAFAETWRAERPYSPQRR